MLSLHRTMGSQDMCGFRNFRQGGGEVSLTKKSFDNVFFVLFFVFFLVLTLFYRSQMVIFKENFHFPRFQRRSDIFQWGWGGWGVQLFPGGSNCLFPIETHITCDFPGGGVQTPCPTLWIRTCKRSDVNGTNHIVAFP